MSYSFRGGAWKRNGRHILGTFRRAPTYHTLKTLEKVVDLTKSPAAEVRLLLAALADPVMESTFGETPREVALQNAAAFLGKESQETWLEASTI